MRTIKFLGLAVALAAASVSANAQAGRRFDHFSGINDLARLEARQIEWHQMRRHAMARAPRMGYIRGMQRGARPGVMLRRGLAMRGPMGMRSGRIAGLPRGRQLMMPDR